jgi:tight adherence protein C
MQLLVALLIGGCVAGLAAGMLEQAQRWRGVSADALTHRLHQEMSRISARIRWPLFQKYRKTMDELLREIPLKASVDADLLMTLQWVCAVVACGVFALVGPFFSLCAGVVFSILPYFYCTTQRKKLHERLLRSLPDCMDLIALVMEAGVDFSAGVDCFVRKGAAGPLRDLFATYQKETQMGLSRTDALHRLGGRTSFAPLREALKGISHALSLGGRLAPSLYEQAAVLRAKRMQLAEKKAAEAPLKVLFPLFAFIFPTVFIVLFGPVLLLFLKGGF